MTTLEQVQEYKKLVDAFVKDEITEDEFYAKLRELAASHPEELRKLREYAAGILSKTQERGREKRPK